MNAALKHPGLQLRCKICRMILVKDCSNLKSHEYDEKKVNLHCPGCGSNYSIRF